MVRDDERSKPVLCKGFDRRSYVWLNCWNRFLNRVSQVRFLPRAPLNAASLLPFNWLECEEQCP
jgi:hypothetical protein